MSKEVDTREFTRTQATALTTILEVQRAAHLSPDYRRHLSTMILRALSFDDLCTVTRALIPTLHLARSQPQPPQKVVV